MKYRLNNKLTAAFVFAVGVFLFWRVGFPHVMSFHEQYQMFLFDWDYLTDRLAVPGGFAVYVASFFVQFCYDATLGALVIAFLLLGGQWITWRLARREGAGEEHYVLTFLPVVGYMCAMMNVHFLLGNIVGYIVALLLAWGYGMIEKRALRWTMMAVVLPLTFWLVGPGAYVLFAFFIIREWRSEGNRVTCLLLTLIAVAYMMGIVLMVYRLSTYSLYRIVLGVGCNRYKEYDPTVQILLIALWACIPFVLAMLPRRRSIVAMCGEVGAMVGLVAGVSYVMCGTPSLRIVKYDYLVRNHDWAGVLENAKKIEPSYPVEVISVNMALAMRGELADRMFEYPQYGVKGLLPTYNKDLNNAMVSSELYYQLGMINTAQRLAFESQESLSDKVKSSRLTLRLAETNMINGNYEVAKKYARLLMKTFAYRDKATRLMELMDDEAMIDRHAVYGMLRRYRLVDDFYYTESEADQMLGFLFVHNNDNLLAFVYLMAYELENKNIERFMKYYPLIEYIKGYSRIPRSYQEMIAYWWRQEHDSFKDVPYALDQQVMREMEEFIKAFMKNPQSKIVTEGKLSKTLWNFLFVEKDEKTEEE